jgi:predicted DNA-binding WGR domain protein
MSRREFHFTEGGSKKFWAIEVEGKGFTVHFGRLGTTGQAQKKEFASDAEAQKAADKLIAEKTKKGYAEVSAAARAVPAATVKAAPAVPKPKAEQVAPPPPAPPQPAPARPAEVTRRIDLDPADWFWATWRDLPPLPRPERAAAPFDLDRCLAQLRGLQWVQNFWWNWGGLKLPGVFSREEANFWFRVLTGLDQGGKASRSAPAELARRLEKVDFSAPVPFDELLSRAGAVGSQPQIDLLFNVLASLVTPAEACSVLMHESLWQTQWYWVRYVTHWFAWQVRPYLTAREREEIRARVASTLDLKDWPAAFNQMPPPAFFLAALVGVHEPLRELVQSWPDNQYTAPDHWDSCHLPQVIVFGLGDPRLVEHHFRRLRLSLSAPDYLRAWLAHTEYGGLDLVRDVVQSAQSKDEAEKVLHLLAAVKAPEAAPYLLELQHGSKAPKQASQWLEEETANAVVGLVPAAGGRGKLADAAVDFLRDAKRRGLTGLIEQGLQGLPADGAAKVRREVLEHAEKVYEPLDEHTTPAWLAGAVKRGKEAKAPDWARPERLPPLVFEGRRLNDAQVEDVLAALRRSGLGAPAGLVTALRQHLDRRALGAFAWRLFELWQGEGAPTKEKWAMTALGHLGGDESVLKLTPLLKVWPGEGQHARAVHGLECLRAVGTDTALTQLNGIAQKLKFKGLQNKAREFMEAIATDRGMTKEQLEDRIVPDLGLDERGSRTLDFGPRQFQVVLGPDLAPLVRGEDGKAKADLPKPGAKDDAAKAAEAVADWKVLKKALRDAVKVQAHRLEQAMVTGRRWSAEEFETLLVRHPLMVNLVRRLLWAGFGKDGKPLRTFRVTDEREYADAKDAACSPEGVAAVGVVHPLHLSAAERGAWGEVFGDYEIIAPFPQLGRALHHLEPGEAAAQDITRFAKVKVPGVSVAGALEKAGWSRGYLQDHGDFHEYFKFFPGGCVTAVVAVEPGLWASNIADPQEQSLPHCYFLAGQARPDWRRDPSREVPPGRVDPVVVSEVLADLVLVASKGK